MTTTKCENCGATLQIDTENAIKFCPYCGYALKLPEDMVDLAKFAMKHEEAVRQRKVEEKRKDDKRIWMIIAIPFIVAILAVSIYFIVRGNGDAKVDQIAVEVQQLIMDGDYDTALVKAQLIRVEKQGIFDDHYNKYENLRNDLIKLIEQKKRESN